jgi:hypothetical protein
MKYSLVFLLVVYPALGQTKTTASASVSGTVIEATTLKAVPAALVTASRAGAPPFSRNTKSGGDGAFQIQGLEAGDYLVCVQAMSGPYLDPCQWNGNPVGIKLSAAQAAIGIKIALTPATVLNVEVKDAQKALRQLTKDGRRPDLSIGVWGPRGLYYPALEAGVTPGNAAAQASATARTYRLAIPADTPLNLHVASRDVRLGDANGVALPNNASQQAFQHAKGAGNQRSFTFTVLGRLP